MTLLLVLDQDIVTPEYLLVPAPFLASSSSTWVLRASKFLFIPSAASWESIRGEKFKIDGTKSERKSVLDNLDRWRKLTSQNPNYEWIVLYNGSGSDIKATATDRPRLIVEHKAYYYTDVEKEAFYLAAMLNSDILLESLAETRSDTVTRRPCAAPV